MNKNFKQKLLEMEVGEVLELPYAVEFGGSFLRMPNGWILLGNKNGNVFIPDVLNVEISTNNSYPQGEVDF
jgi:hypothetical protein